MREGTEVELPEARSENITTETSKAHIHDIDTEGDNASISGDGATSSTTVAGVTVIVKEVEDTEGEKEKDAEPETSSLVMVALLGSMDDMSVFFGLLLAETFEPISLSLGVLIGSALVSPPD